MRRVSSLSADLSSSLALCTGIAIRVHFGVGCDYGAENPRLGRVVPSIRVVARHLLRLCVPRCLTAAYFHAGASRSLGRRLALGQDRPPFCRGYRHPVDYPVSICRTRSQGEILFLVSSSRLLLTPSVAPTDDHQSRADGVPFLSMMIYSFLNSIVFLASRVPHLSQDMLPALADYNYPKTLCKGASTHVYISHQCILY
jgi:hypothetical protein